MINKLNCLRNLYRLQLHLDFANSASIIVIDNYIYELQWWIYFVFDFYYCIVTFLLILEELFQGVVEFLGVWEVEGATDEVFYVLPAVFIVFFQFIFFNFLLEPKHIGFNIKLKFIKIVYVLLDFLYPLHIIPHHVLSQEYNWLIRITQISVWFNLFL